MTKDSKGQPINMESDIWNGNVTRTPASGNSFEGSTPRMFAYSQNLTDTIPGKDTPHILQFAICDTEDSGLDSGVFAVSTYNDLAEKIGIIKLMIPRRKCIVALEQVITASTLLGGPTGSNNFFLLCSMNLKSPQSAPAKSTGPF